MDFEQLRLFKDVVELGSFSRAGRRVHLSRSGVSLQIKRLEADLGCQLLERRGRAGSRMTPEGRLLFSYCTRMLEMQAGLADALGALRHGTLGSVSVGATLTAFTYLMPPAVRAFNQRHPGVGVDVVGGFVPDLLDALDRGEIDLAVVWGPVEARAFRHEWVMDDELLAVVPLGHPLAGRGAVAASELEGFPAVLPARRSISRRFVADRLRDAGVLLQPIVEFGTPAASKEAVLAGLGIGFLSPFALRRELAAGQMVGLRIEGVDLRRQLVLASRRGACLSPAAERFSVHLRQLLRSPSERESAGGDAAIPPPCRGLPVA